MDAGRGLDYVAHRFHAFAVPGDARQMAALGPAAVAVHDDGHVFGELVRVQLAEDFSLFTIQPRRNDCAQDLPLYNLNGYASSGGADGKRYARSRAARLDFIVLQVAVYD